MSSRHWCHQCEGESKWWIRKDAIHLLNGTPFGVLKCGEYFLYWQSDALSHPFACCRSSFALQTVSLRLVLSHCFAIIFVTFGRLSDGMFPSWHRSLQSPRNYWCELVKDTMMGVCLPSNDTFRVASHIGGYFVYIDGIIKLCPVSTELRMP